MAPETELLAPQLALLDACFPQRVVALADGARVAIRQAGPEGSQAPTMVLLHGIGSGAASWLEVARQLADRVRVVAWDAPGYGESTPLSPASPLASDYAQRLAALLKALAVERCILVGHSLGAMMASAFAAGPGATVVQRLVLLSPARGYGGPDRVTQSRKILEGRLGKLAESGIEGMAADSPKRMLSEHTTPAARAWVQWNTSRLNPAGYTQAVRMLCGDAIEAYRPLAMPVEVAVGALDVVTLPADCQALARDIGAPFSLVEAAGHACPVEQAEQVAALLARAAARPPETHA